MKWVALQPFTISFRVVLPFFAIGLGASIGRCRECPSALRHAAKRDPGSDLAFRFGCDDAVGGWVRLLLDLTKVSLSR
jgi:hypothetical protein